MASVRVMTRNYRPGARSGKGMQVRPPARLANLVTAWEVRINICTEISHRNGFNDDRLAIDLESPDQRVLHDRTTIVLGRFLWRRTLTRDRQPAQHPHGLVLR